MTTTTYGGGRPMRTSIHGRRLGLADDDTVEAAGQIDSFTGSIAPGTSNVATVTLQAVNSHGDKIAAVVNFDAWLSDAATGAGLTATGLSSELTATTGALISVDSTEKAWRLQTDATGLCVVSLTDTGKHTTYFANEIPGRSASLVSPQLVAGNYG